MCAEREQLVQQLCSKPCLIPGSAGLRLPRDGESTASHALPPGCWGCLFPLPRWKKH